jgi:2-polyprenyl-6-methoxyphenol hydroxylase-like FAD-dependent oxidoreductase
VGDERSIEARYDVVIVGGRPAGASLAARLGAQGVPVLVVDRAELPSPPAVPSCPVLYPVAMALLDELGLDESAYGAGSTRVRTLCLEVGTWFNARMVMPTSRGRDYVYSLDRVPFDDALWRHLARYPSVSARSSVSFVDLVRDDGGRVTGVELREGDGPVRRVLADVVVGADGRFSAVARKAGARIIEDCPDHTSTVYFAEWEGYPPFDDSPEPAVLIHVTNRGLDLLHFPLPGGKTTIVTHHRSDRARIDGDAEAYYEGLLRAQPAERRRLEGAHRVTPVVGVKRIANRYLDAGGPGWVLVGDAVHHKDPVDGQGIYDALIGSKLLAQVLADVRAGKLTSDAGLARYRAELHTETHGMFRATMDRLKRELYTEPPELVVRTLMRWLVTDAGYQRRFLQFLCRDIPAEGWLTPSLMRDAAIRGALGDLRRLVRRGRDQGDGRGGSSTLRPE